MWKLDQSTQLEHNTEKNVKRGTYVLLW